MLIDVASDLHVQFIEDVDQIIASCNKTDSKILLIAGDISDNIKSTIYVKKELQKHYDIVLFELGNHDRYSNTIDDVDLTVQALNDPTFFNSQNRFYIVDRTVFISVTGWYDLKCYEHLGFSFDEAKQEWYNIKRDSQYIFHSDKFPWDYAELEKNELVSLVKRFDQDNDIDNIVISTHMIPSKDFVNIRGIPEWDRSTPSYVNSFMVDEVSKENTNKKIKLWVYGHTHDRDNFIYNDIQFINNARGYGMQTYGWDIMPFNI